MRGQLRLISSRTTPNDRIIAAIRPLSEKVRPSAGFRRETRLRLLHLMPEARQARIA